MIRDIRLLWRRSGVIILARAGYLTSLEKNKLCTYLQSILTSKVSILSQFSEIKHSSILPKLAKCFSWPEPGIRKKKKENKVDDYFAILQKQSKT